jgi:glutamate--cysteine ligase
MRGGETRWHTLYNFGPILGAIATGTTILYAYIEQQLARLIAAGHGQLLNSSCVGLEKETLRVNKEGGIAQTPHPRVLGSALTNPYITTDYSEALIEFITPPFPDMREALAFLRDTQTFVYTSLKDETLWATSMPCVVAGETSIPIAQYGSSNLGMMKHVYRRGLAYRYGRVMQVIAGVHYNFSYDQDFWQVWQELQGDVQPLQDFISQQYFGMLRNLQRLGWLVPYLFGASPAVCKSFLDGRAGGLQSFNENTFYEPYATSLRMGDIGYQNNRENDQGIKANYDSVDSYVESLTCAIETPCAEYEALGVKVNGEYRQLNANILQIENEYYSTVRPKQVLQDNEKPSLALKKRGVQYIELRSIDVNAFDPLGINEEQLHFLEALMALCLLMDSPNITQSERGEIDANELLTAHRGREPGLQLLRHGKAISLREWATEVTDAMQGICELLDEGVAGSPYTAALQTQRESIRDAERTPSARMLASMREHDEGFYHFARRMSQQHFDYFKSQSLDEARRVLFENAARDSLAKQAAIEAGDNCDFDEYLARYFAQR